MRYGTTKPGGLPNNSWHAGAVVLFTYDGTYWVMNDNNDGLEQSLTSSNWNLPLLLSYASNTDTTTSIVNKSYRNNSIYANPSTGNIQATKLNGVTIGSTPAFTDTNNAVTQTATTTNSAYEVLFSGTADNTTRTEGARKTDTFKYNPSTDTLTAGNINLSGNISTTTNSGLNIWGEGTNSHVIAKMVKGTQVAFSNLNSVWDDGQGTVTTEVVTSTDTDGTFVFYSGLKKGLVDLIYPIGSIYLSVSNTNPGDLFGGTWVSFGAGRTLVGVDTSDTDFDTVEETGGAKSRILRATIGAVGNDPNYIAYECGAAITGHGSCTTATGYNHYRLRVSSYVSNPTNSYNHSTTVWDASTGKDPSTLQPYITTYMWKRTA